MKQKTVKQWFESLPEGELKTKLLANLKQIYSGVKTDSIHGAVLRGFSWDESLEKYDFWDGVHDCLKTGCNKFGGIIVCYNAGYNLAKETMEGQDG